MGASLLMLGLRLALNGAYGFHTDELYYIVSGRHPALGYVDFPPVTPLLARAETAFLGTSPWTLRLLPAVAGAAMVLLTGLCARELGGSRGAAAFAALVALLSPYLLATWLFQTVEFDAVLWLAAIYLLLRLLRSGDQRLFILLGIDLGIGIETKFTILALAVGVVAAVLSSPDLRPSLRTPYPWLGLAIAVLGSVPNVTWQLANGFPTLLYVANHGSDIAQSGGPLAFVALFALVVGPVLFPLWIAGLVLLARDPRLRPMAVLVAVAIALFLPDGKAYYPAPTVPFVLAAGCVALSGMQRPALRRWTERALGILAVVEAAILSPIILPLVPPASMHRLGIDKLNADFANTVGWPEMTAQVAAVYNSLPPDQRDHAAILASIDGEAGAIDIYGGADHLPQAISPHLSFWYWKPAGLNPDTLVTVGYSPRDLSFLCGHVTEAATVTSPDSIDNLTQGAPILVCTELREPLSQAWPRLRNFS